MGGYPVRCHSPFLLVNFKLRMEASESDGAVRPIRVVYSRTLRCLEPRALSGVSFVLPTSPAASASEEACLQGIGLSSVTLPGLGHAHGVLKVASCRAQAGLWSLRIPSHRPPTTPERGIQSGGDGRLWYRIEGRHLAPPSSSPALTSTSPGENGRGGRPGISVVAVARGPSRWTSRTCLRERDPQYPSSRRKKGEADHGSSGPGWPVMTARSTIRQSRVGAQAGCSGTLLSTG